MAAHRPAGQQRSGSVFHFSALTMVWAVVAVVAVVPLLIDLSNLADTYHGPKARALYVFAPVIAVAWLASARVVPQAVDTRIIPPAAAFAAAAIVATAVGVNPAWSLLGAPWRHEGLLTLLAYVVLFLATAHVVASSYGRRWMQAVLAGATLVAAYGLAQYLGYEWLVRDAQHLDLWQAFSTTGNPNFLGMYMVLVVPLAIAAVLSARGIVWATVATAALALIFLTGLATYSRSSWGALAVSIAIFTLLSIRRNRNVSLRRYLLVVALLTLLAGLFFWPQGPLAPRVAGVSPSAKAGSGAADRVLLWAQSAELLAGRPLLGYGPEAFSLVFPKAWVRQREARFNEPFPVIVDKAHNDTLDMAMSIGLIGVAAYCWLLITVLRRAWQAAQTPGSPQLLGIACLAGIAGYWFDLQFQFSVVSVAPVFWSLLGAGAGLPAIRTEQAT